jgi:hypothetical protein
MRRLIPAVVFSLIALLSWSAAAQTLPRRDGAAPPARQGTAVVRGRVTAAGSGAPLRRVRITLAGGALANPLTSVTNVRGEFEVRAVPAGSYSLTAARPGYLTVQHGQRRPGEAGRPIEVAEQQVAERIDIALPRASALSGRVFDEAGDPAPGVTVEAMEIRYVRGRREPITAGMATTNDIGQFRIGGLEPGTYYLRAASVETWQSEDGRETFAYSHTFYPGVSGLNQTRALTVPVGEHMGGLDFALVPGRAAAVSGTLAAASGEPLAGRRVNMDRIGRNAGGGLGFAAFAGNTTTRADGTFEIRGLPPGEYMLYSGSRDTEEARQQIFVAGSDVHGVLLSPHRTTIVSGRIDTEDGRPPDFPAPRLRIVPFAVDESLPVWGTPSPQTLGADWTFRLNSITGRFLFRLAGLPDGWMLQSVRAAGRDITDLPWEIAPGAGEIKDVQVVISRTAARLTGRLLDVNGRPTADGTVVVFAADPARWTIGSRFVRAIRPRSDGGFELGDLPAGAYFAAAREFVPDGAWEDQDFLRELSTAAVRFDLRNAPSEPITVRIQEQP